MMLEQVQNFIKQEALFNTGDRLILACSGGKDSMVLIDVLRKLNYAFVVAYCNYNLRGAESEADLVFLKKYCEYRQLDFRSVSFETSRISKEQKRSIQDLARSLRYNWLEDIRKEENAQTILTAHHLQDNIETLLFKLAKGTGIKGIRGMLPKQGNIVRPLLQVSLEEIQQYIKVNEIEYREDSSNLTLKYDRNKIRHQVLGPLKEINQGLNATMKDHFTRWNDIEKMHDIIVAEWKQKLLKPRKGSFFISIKKLLNYGVNYSLLFELFRPYGFNASDVTDLVQGMQQSDVKVYLSKEYRILKDRKFLIVTPLKQMFKAEHYPISKGSKNLKIENDFTLSFSVKTINKLRKINKKPSHAYLDVSKLSYPLILRKWKTGDYFYPIGLQKPSGKSSKKNIGKFLRDQKISAFDKENTWVLISGERIAWVLAHRIDDRFKITPNTIEVLAISQK